MGRNENVHKTTASPTAFEFTVSCRVLNADNIISSRNLNQQRPSHESHTASPCVQTFSHVYDSIHVTVLEYVENGPSEAPMKRLQNAEILDDTGEDDGVVDSAMNEDLVVVLVGENGGLRRVVATTSGTGFG